MGKQHSCCPASACVHLTHLTPVTLLPGAGTPLTHFAPIALFSGCGTLPWDLTAVPAVRNASAAGHLPPSQWTSSALAGMAVKKKIMLQRLLYGCGSSRATLTFSSWSIPVFDVVPPFLKE